MANPVFGSIGCQREHFFDASFMDTGAQAKKYAEAIPGEKGMRGSWEYMITGEMSGTCETISGEELLH